MKAIILLDDIQQVIVIRTQFKNRPVIYLSYDKDINQNSRTVDRHLLNQRIERHRMRKWDNAYH